MATTERPWFYVGVMTSRNYIQWVTWYHPRERLVIWEEYKLAIPMDYQRAKEITYGLKARGVNAIMVREPDITLHCNRKGFFDGEASKTI